MPSSSSPPPDPLQLFEVASSPTAILNGGFVYSKDVATISELHYREDSGAGGTEIQITNDGALNVSAATVSPLTTKGDIWIYAAADTRLPIGANGRLLQCDSGEASGMGWDLTLTGAYTFSAAQIFSSTVALNGAATLADATALLIGASGGSLQYSTAQTPDSVVLAAGALTKTIVICDEADKGTDLGAILTSNPTIKIYSSDAVSTEWASYSVSAAGQPEFDQGTLARYNFKQTGTDDGGIISCGSIRLANNVNGEWSATYLAMLPTFELRWAAASPTNGTKDWGIRRESAGRGSLTNGAGADTGSLLIGGDLELDGALNHDGSTLGVYGTAPIAQQTGVAVSAAGIHAACVALGLFTA